MCRVRRTREVGRGRWGRKNILEVRSSPNVTDMSKHRLWLENSVSLYVAAVWRMRKLARDTDKVLERGLGKGLVPY